MFDAGVKGDLNEVPGSKVGDSTRAVATTVGEAPADEPEIGEMRRGGVFVRPLASSSMVSMVRSLVPTDMFKAEGGEENARNVFCDDGA